MIDVVVARKYAKSFLRITGADEGHKKKYEEAFLVLLQLYEIPESADVLKSYVMPREVKEELLSLAFHKGDAPEELRSFVLNLLDAGRIKFLPEVLNCYCKLLREALGEVVAEAFVCYPLSAEEAREVTTQLELLLNKKVCLSVRVDKTILGGMRVRVGNTVIDCSLSHKLDTLTAQVAS